MLSNMLSEIANDALLTANREHLKLGLTGLEKVSKNQFGDTALKADIAAEKTVLNILKTHNIPILVKSEEHGSVTIGNKPQFFAVLDGLDGTNVYKSTKGHGRYGTMLGIFKGTDPQYADYLYSGIMIHSTGELFYVVRDSGAWVLKNDLKKPLVCSTKQILNRNTRFWVDKFYDQYYGTNIITPYLSKFSLFKIRSSGSSAVHYVDLASGKVNAVIECTRKGNLEIATSYGLIKEAGGVMMTLDGEDLGDKKYLQFAQQKGEHIIIVSTGTQQLNNTLRRLLIN